jgi:hypothetical protein
MSRPGGPQRAGGAIVEAWWSSDVATSSFAAKQTNERRRCYRDIDKRRSQERDTDAAGERTAGLDGVRCLYVVAVIAALKELQVGGKRDWLKLQVVVRSR